MSEQDDVDVSGKIYPAFNWRRAALHSDLSPLSKLLVVCLAEFMWDGKDWATPSTSTLAKMMGCSVNSVSNHMDNLKQSGWIVAKRRLNDSGSYTSNKYFATVPEVEAIKTGHPALNDPPPPRDGVPQEMGEGSPRDGGGVPQEMGSNQLNIKQKKEINKSLFVTGKLFENFWKIYPRKNSKGDALRAWNKLCNSKNPNRPEWKTIRRAIYEQSKTKQWQSDQSNIPLPATWLNKLRWLNSAADIDAGWAAVQKIKQEKQNPSPLLKKQPCPKIFTWNMDGKEYNANDPNIPDEIKDFLRENYDGYKY